MGQFQREESCARTTGSCPDALSYFCRSRPSNSLHLPKDQMAWFFTPQLGQILSLMGRVPPVGSPMKERLRNRGLKPDPSKPIMYRFRGGLMRATQSHETTSISN